MKKPTSIKLDEHVEGWDGPQFVTTVSFGGQPWTDDFVIVSHDDYSCLDFSMTRDEARKLRNFLNKCLEW